jgi:hypothetical protein
MTDDLDLESRRLCPDGACLGVLDDAGRCGECGRHFGSDVHPVPDASSPAPASEAPFDEERQLCPDGACTGLLGPDGHCKECGRSSS